MTLKVDHIEKRFGARRVLSDVSMQIDGGQCYALFGANGSGKTTLALLLASLTRPTRGTITYEKSSVTERDARYRTSVGFLTHSSLLYEDLSGYENLALFSGLYGVSNPQKRIIALSSLFSVESRLHEPVRALSRGLKQRLSIIRALIHDPTIIILDEPFTGLDETSAQRLHTLLLEQLRSKKHILITTHNLLRGFQIATKVGILAGGKIPFETTPDRISLAELQKTYERTVSHETA